ncbi:tripartite tricarboxylate transporter TctB family protein [Roseomonas sp. NAR14]|uniref:Tripartite tricarboxylate transporter TctB family protein n=1 Tax=Roseomonas acroporae TaxID=2937791 RepID=A0A9X1Y8C9_9PROT|nr:tripartite tricarboxylate transporter TctB family protein [Roseomonas acroporae]
MRPEPRAAWPDFAVGLGILALGGLALWQAAAIPPSPVYAQLGPKAVPYLVAAGLLLLGCGLTASALRGGWSAALPEVREAPPPNRRAFAWLLAGLAVNLLLIDRLGFVVAATGQFVLVARAFGSRRPLRDLAIGLAVTLAAYLGFDRVLGVSIGAGILEGWL